LRFVQFLLVMVCGYSASDKQTSGQSALTPFLGFDLFLVCLINSGNDQPTIAIAAALIHIPADRP